ncbi:39S ribosomal protein L12, mitochondrial [Leptopilina boulardi]|uniref:39S ribosomal protein L12, mitochondrial n=1 Tax=Leptopilina boulardi TaxID=63433 RepID=UPI0021F5C2DC|nr:39S ribosomal protein L12, mitochondrial [Leptopilina boulardi]
MNSIRIVLQKNVHQLRQFHKCIALCQTEASAAVAEKMTIPVPEGVDKPVSAKIDKIANEISALNLIEVAELSDVLKKRLNLPDAPVMPMGGFQVAPQKEDEEVEAPKTVQTAFTIKLTSFEDSKKVTLIKEIKALLPGTNLVQAKKFVESVPVVVKSDISKEEAEQLKEALAKAGGVSEIS